jgi:Ca2+-binding RTX toxin-like protein
MLSGGDGYDTLDGGAGADRLVGGADDDVYIVDDAGDEVVELDDEGIDSVQSRVDRQLAANVENLKLLGTADLDGRGNGLANSIVGNKADNELFGFDGADGLYGDAGDDLLDGGAGIDRMSGGTGDDRYIVDDSLDVVSESGNSGFDEVTASVSYTLSANVERLVLSGVADIDGTGGAGVNEVIGNSGANRLAGGWGDDVLRGGGGDDTLIFDSGLDSLWGGDGADRFVLNWVPNAAGDRIEDLQLGDVIDLSAIDANGKLKGDQAFELIAGDFTGRGGELNATLIAGGSYKVSADINGDLAADLVFHVTSDHLLGTGDFVF